MGNQIKFHPKMNNLELFDFWLHIRNGWSENKTFRNYAFFTCNWIFEISKLIIYNCIFQSFTEYSVTIKLSTNFCILLNFQWCLLNQKSYNIFFNHTKYRVSWPKLSQSKISESNTAREHSFLRSCRDSVGENRSENGSIGQSV